jgi:DNA-binding transcriptional regulator PaaX
MLEKNIGKTIETKELIKICKSAGFSEEAFSALQKYSGNDEKVEWEKFLALAISMTAEVC